MENSHVAGITPLFSVLFSFFHFLGALPLAPARRAGPLGRGALVCRIGV